MGGGGVETFNAEFPLFSKTITQIIRLHRAIEKYSVIRQAFDFRNVVFELGEDI